ncbi:MAG: chordopoxvirus fusion protein [Calditrichaeota bacterium]|nr:MAG: chordopoxvirus fusion protein [Calditrichota bacterium]
MNSLAEAQKKTEQRLDSLAAKVELLAEAQQKTEQRLNSLAEAQKKTEQRLDSLAAKVELLTEAQKKTEQRLNSLAEAQKKTEQRLDSLTEKLELLAEAQRSTEIQIKQLAKDQQETRRQLGGLAMTVGYTLENAAYKALPKLLEKDFGLKVDGRLKRGFVKDDRGQTIEVNILGHARKDGQLFFLIGEAKAQLSKNDIDRFLRKKLQRFKGRDETLFPILVTHMISSEDVEQYAKEKGVALYYSYDF